MTTSTLTPRRVRIITACACAIALFSLVAATVRDVRGAEMTTAEKDNLTVEQALNVAAGLGQLVSYDTVDKEGKPAKGYYKFSADLRFIIAINIDLGTRVQTQFRNANNEIAMQLSGGIGAVPPEKKGAYDVEIAKLFAAPSRVGFVHIKLSDLKLEENPIPGPVLSLIVPIIDR